MHEALLRDSSNRLMFRRGIAATRNAGPAASSVRAAQSGRARSFARHPVSWQAFRTARGRSTLRIRSNISQLLALRAAVLRRAVSQWIWRRCQAPGNSAVPPTEFVAYSGNRVPHRTSHEPFHRTAPGSQSGGNGGRARLRATHQFLQRSWSRMLAIVCLIEHRPNPSIERTSNGGAQCPAPSRVVTPLCAAHVKR